MPPVCGASPTFLVSRWVCSGWARLIGRPYYWQAWSGLVDSVRGPGGGYHLARAPETVAVSDIIVAVDEPIDATQCGGRENCLDDHRCMTHELWAGLNAHIFAYLRSVTLAELVRQQRAKPGDVAVLHDQRHRATSDSTERADAA